MNKESLKSYVKRFTDWGWGVGKDGGPDNLRGVFYMDAGSFFVKRDEEREHQEVMIRIERDQQPAVETPQYKKLDFDAVSFPAFSRLSSRNRQLVLAIMSGLNNREIAQLRGLTVSTINNQVSTLLKSKGLGGSGKKGRLRLIDSLIESGDVVLKDEVLT